MKKIRIFLASLLAVLLALCVVGCGGTTTGRELVGSSENAAYVYVRQPGFSSFSGDFTDDETKAAFLSHVDDVEFQHKRKAPEASAGDYSFYVCLQSETVVRFTVKANGMAVAVSKDKSGKQKAYASEEAVVDYEAFKEFMKTHWGYADDDDSLLSWSLDW